MAGVSGYQIYPCRGEYFILDQVASELLTMPAYPVPRLGIGGLGVHLTPTVHGNLIIGPSAEYIDSRNDYACTKDIMEKLFREAKQLLPTLDWKQIIGNYSGIRPKQAPPGEGGFRDFVIKEEDTCPGLINLIGIESPADHRQAHSVEQEARIHRNAQRNPTLSGMFCRGADAID